MGVMEKLKVLYERMRLPKDVSDIIARSRSPKQIKEGLEILRGQNEIELRKNEDQLIALEKAVRVEKERIREGGLTMTEKTIVLRRIERLTQQRTTIENLVNTYNANANLHLALISKIQELEAMEMQGVGEEKVDELLDTLDVARGDYRIVGFAADGLAAVGQAVDSTEEQRRLAELERQILEEEGKEATELPEQSSRRLE